MGLLVDPREESHPLAVFLIQMFLVLVTTRALGRVTKRFHQPAVVGEIFGGVLLGPSVLGQIPGFTAFVFPERSLIALHVVSNIGLILFMFFLGLELDPRLVRGQLKQAAPIALSAIGFPFMLGALLSVWIYDEVHQGGTVDKTSFALFFGSSLSFTAFPVLASMLQAKKLVADPLGLLALSTAAVDDVSAWCVLAFASSFARTSTPIIGLYTTLLAALYLMVMVLGVHPCLKLFQSRFAPPQAKLASKVVPEGDAEKANIAKMASSDSNNDNSDKDNSNKDSDKDNNKSKAKNNDNKNNAAAAAHHETRLKRAQVTVVLLVLLVSAFASEIIGIHAFFGAFVAGLVIPKDDDFVRTFAPKLELVVVDFLLPLYFANSGLRTELGSIQGLRGLGITLFLLLVACVGKFVPACLMTRFLTKRPWRFCFAIGMLMNTRGLIALVVLNIGLDMGVLSMQIFSMMVVVALATTLMTAPSLNHLYVNQVRHASVNVAVKRGPIEKQLLMNEGYSTLPFEFHGAIQAAVETAAGEES